MDEINKTEKPKFWKRKIGMFGKQIPVVTLLLVLVGGLGSASLLLYFGQIKTTANVQQAVTLLGSPTHEIPEDAPGGEMFCYLHKLDNKASVDIDVGFGTECYRNGAWENEGHTCGGVTTTTYNISETRTLELCKKNPADWQCVGGATATLTFDPVSPTFKGTLTTLGLVDENYALIYYPDKVDRFDPSKWNGAGGKVIATWNGNANNLAIDTNLGINLPDGTLPDWNINPIPDYCDFHNGFDDYVHCKGAKLWIVKTSDLTGGVLPLMNWNPTEWLFEKDLIVYSDCDLDPEDFAVDMEKTEVLETLTTKSRGKTPMLVCYDFASNIAEGTYVVTTNIVP